MQQADKPEMVRLLVGLAAVKPGGKLTPEALEIWWLALNDWPISEFRAAVQHLALATQFFPTPYDFAQLRLASRPTAGEAFARAVVHAGSGAWRNADIDDPHVGAAVRALGGWGFIAMCETEKLPFIERRFCEHYDAITDAGDTREALPQIAGPQNTRRIGGPQKLSAVISQQAGRVV